MPRTARPRGQPSALFRTLDARLPTAAWQGEILRTFQTWAAAADVNVRVVPDGGQPFGTLGLKQGDPRFGDIRIGAFPMAADALAVADPYDPFIANTSVGDVFLNSSVALRHRRRGRLLRPVLGHAARGGPRLRHRPQQRPEFADVRAVPPGADRADAADDRCAAVPLRATRADPFEGVGGNDTFATATALSLTGGAGVIGAASSTPTSPR